MLSPATMEVALRDPEIPGLATVLDSEALLAALRRAVPRADLGNAQIRSVRIEPHSLCRVTCRVEVAGEPVSIDVLACRPADLAARAADHESGAAAGPLGPSPLVLEQQSLVVTVFPHDRRLSALRELTDMWKRDRLLRRLLPGRPELWSGQLRILRYRPERRYVAELRAAAGARVLLKAGTQKGYARSRLHATAFRSQGPLRVARLLGADEEQCVLAFEWLPGVELFDLCAAEELDEGTVARAGAALAELHSQDPEGLLPRPHEVVFAALSSAWEEIGFTCPHLAPRAGGLARRLASRLGEAPGMRVPLHGDLSTRHVLVDGKQSGLIDLDSACRGDPADDLGSIFAQVERHVVSGDLPAHRVSSFRRAFLQGYGESGRRRVPGRVDLHMAVELFRGARFPVRRLEPDWVRRTEGLLDRAEDILVRGAAESR